MKEQLQKIDLHRQNVIEIKSPNEYRLAEETAISNFYKTSKQEIGNLLTKIDELRERSINTGDKTEEISLKKELNKIREAKPSFTFKLEKSGEIIVGEASEKSIQERNFISSYVDYQLKQPETRFRFENERYRIYAATLEIAKNRTDVIRISSEIRAENAAIGLKWKDLEKKDKEKQPRPLTNKEMQFLFTEVSPVHYTPEMTAIRLAYAHSGTSRRSMTESLIRNEIKPSPEANKLIVSLESRLQRRDLVDSISATKHFFESIKTPNEFLKHKNQFNHRKIYKQLPPPEKDFVYFKATQQKENLEYRHAFRQHQLTKANEIALGEKSKPEVTKTERSFHFLSDFNQARILGEKLAPAVLLNKEIGERDFSAIAILLKNQTTDRLELISSEFQESSNIENKKIGEVLETFRKAEISKENNKTTVQIKLPENGLVEKRTYAELLEKLYPENEQENNKYKKSNFGKDTLAWAREKGQDETIKVWRKELTNNVYQSQVSASVFTTEKTILKTFESLENSQQIARTARRENENILTKYSNRTAKKIQDQKLSIPNSKNQFSIVTSALGGQAAELTSNKINNKFFQTVQKEITISDLNKFAANEKLISDLRININEKFAEISRDVSLLDETKYKTSDIRDESLHQTYQRIQKIEENRLLTEKARNIFETGENLDNKTITDLVENAEKEAIKITSFNQARIAVEPIYKSDDEKNYNEQALKLADKLEKAHELSYKRAPQTEIVKAFESAEKEKSVLDKIAETKDTKPLSLQLFENELGKAEKELQSKKLHEKLSADNKLEKENLLNTNSLFSPEERQQIKIEAFEAAKVRLEPKELDAVNRQISPEASRQAFAIYKQLERATNLFQTSDDKSKINESFFKLDDEASKLFKIRQNYNRAEKLALLRDGIKIDLADLLKKNAQTKQDNIEEQINKIVTNNLKQTGFVKFADDRQQVNMLSREIIEKVEAQQIFAIKGKDFSANSREINNQAKNPLTTKENQAKTNALNDAKAKEVPIFIR